MKNLGAVLVLLLAGASTAGAQPIEGYGKDATGGAGFPVCTVTSSAKTGPGTFDDCVGNGGNQTIQFAVATANVNGTSYLRSNTTVDGCANGRSGVTLNLPADQAREVVIEGPASNIVVRCIRFQGSGPMKAGFRSENDLLRLDGESGLVRRVVVDHCTFVGATDGALDIVQTVEDVTVSWNLFYGTPLTQLVKYDTRQRISFHHNVYTAGGERNPQIKGDARDIDFVSNVVYGQTIAKDGLGNEFSPYGTSLRNANSGSDSPGNVEVNVRSSVFAGTDSGLEIDTEPGASDASIYLAPDNFCQGGCPDSPAGSPNPVPAAYAVTATPVVAMASAMLPYVGSPNRTATDKARLAPVTTALLPTLSISGASVTEGDLGYQVALVRVSLSSPQAWPVKVSFATKNGTAVAGRDFVTGSGTLVFPEGTTVADVAVWVTGDVLTENDEAFTVSLSKPVNAALATGSAVVSIQDNDALPGLTVADVQVTEGQAGARNALFKVTMSKAAASDVTVGWATSNLTAQAGADYTAGSNTLTIPRGARNGTITVAVVGDVVDEPNEAFLLTLSGAVGARIVDGRAQGVIWDDDGLKDVATPIASLPYVATRAGRYRLVSDLTFTPAQGAAVTVAANGVTVDLEGHTLTGSGGAGTEAMGVVARNRSGVTVENGRIQSFLAGVFLAGPPPYSVSSKFIVRNLQVESSTYAGIWLEGRASLVEGCTVSGTGGTTALDPGAGAWGIASVGPAPKLTLNQVHDTAATGAGDAFGIAVDSPTTATLSLNSVANAVAGSTTGILVTRATSASVTTNTLDTLAFGIVYSGGAKGTCQGNTITGVPIPVLGATCLP